METVRTNPARNNINDVIIPPNWDASTLFENGIVIGKAIAPAPVTKEDTIIMMLGTFMGTTPFKEPAKEHVLNIHAKRHTEQVHFRYVSKFH
jgi:hypothetical protein